MEGGSEGEVGESQGYRGVNTARHVKKKKKIIIIINKSKSKRAVLNTRSFNSRLL